MAKEMETFPQDSEKAELIKTNVAALISMVVSKGIERDMNPMQIMAGAKMAHLAAEELIEWESEEDKLAFSESMFQHFMDSVELALLPECDPSTMN